MKLAPISSLAFVAFGSALVGCDGSSSEARDVAVRVAKGALAKNAVAVGNIQPAREAAIKSRNGGVLTKLFVKTGDRVEKGAPLAEVRPVWTDEDVLRAERAITSARDGLATAREIQEGENVMGRVMQMLQGRSSLDRMRRAATDATRQAELSLELLRQGHVEVDGKRIDFVVRAPIAGRVIDSPVREGAPVVAASTYGSGTVLMVLADLDAPEFRGTVAEMDVGRLRVGMTARVRIGALPGHDLTGEVIEVGLRAQRTNNAVTFPVRIAVKAPPDLTIRAGYSAVADIEVARRDDVLVLPERVIDFRAGKAFVRVAGEPDREVQCGLSDGITVEITDGLAEGDEVLERVYGSR